MVPTAPRSTWTRVREAPAPTAPLKRSVVALISASVLRTRAAVMLAAPEMSRGRREMEISGLFCCVLWC